MKWHSVSGTHHLIPDHLLMWQMLNVHSSCYGSLCHPYFPSLLPGQVRVRDNIVQKEFACVELHNRGTTYFSYNSLYEANQSAFGGTLKFKLPIAIHNYLLQIRGVWHSESNLPAGSMERLHM